jgi:hypothetical protein
MLAAMSFVLIAFVFPFGYIRNRHKLAVGSITLAALMLCGTACLFHSAFIAYLGR